MHFKFNEKVFGDICATVAPVDTSCQASHKLRGTYSWVRLMMTFLPLGSQPHLLAFCFILRQWPSLALDAPSSMGQEAFKLVTFHPQSSKFLE